MNTWRYTLKPIALDGTDIADAQRGLNSMGESGWEAVAWIPDPQVAGRGWVLLKMAVRSN